MIGLRTILRYVFSLDELHGTICSNGDELVWCDFQASTNVVEVRYCRTCLRRSTDFSYLRWYDMWMNGLRKDWFLLGEVQLLMLGYGYIGKPSNSKVLSIICCVNPFQSSYPILKQGNFNSEVYYRLLTTFQQHRWLSKQIKST